VSGRSERSKKTIKIISVLLILVFINYIFSPTYDAIEINRHPDMNLHPQHRVFRPLIDKELGEKGMLELTLLGRLRNDPDILSSTENLIKDLYAKIVSAATVEVFFSAARRLSLKDIRGEKGLESVFLIPGNVGGTPYFAQIFHYMDGREKTTIYTEEELEGYCKELVERGEFEAPEAEELKVKLMGSSLSDAKSPRFVDLPDESVQAVLSFLEKAEAWNIKNAFLEKIKARKVIISGKPVIFADSIVLREDKGVRKRALSILEGFLLDTEVPFNEVVEAFESFWAVLRKGQAGEFDMDQAYPRLKLMLREADRKAGLASNEGGMRFTDEAYETIMDIRGIELSDCEETIQDIRDIFKKVAEHDMPEKLKRRYELYRWRNQLEKMVNDESFEDAASLRDRIKAREEELGIYDEKSRREDIKELRRIFGNIPGLDPGKIKIEHFLDSILPTDIVAEDGVIRINENFIKLMHRLKIEGLKGARGEIVSYPIMAPPNPLAELYSSIIYSIAIHTIRGHFSVDDQGNVMFDPNESLAQGERGGKYLYMNVLAMLFYWITCVEHYRLPKKRAEFYIKQYPELFRKLTRQEKKKLPNHLQEVIIDFCDSSDFPLSLQPKDTGVVRKDVVDFVERYPGSSSNEGMSRGSRPVVLRLSDESVKLVTAFLEDLGADNIKRLLKEKVENGSIVLSGEADFAAGGLVLRESEDLMQRSRAILDWILVDLGIEMGAASDALTDFEGYYLEDKRGKFDPDKVDTALRIRIRDMDERLGGMSNEGLIEFAEEAYKYTIDLSGVHIEDCREIITYIKRVFKGVAEHDMPEEIRRSYDLYRWRKELDGLVNRERFEDAASLRDRIRKREEQMGIRDEKQRQINIKKLEALFSSIPGLDPHKIKVEDISEGLLPTDIVNPDGTVRLNERFIRLLMLLKMEGDRKHKDGYRVGDIFDYPKLGGDNIIGDFFDSLVHSLVIHTLRGHFPYGDDGMPEVNADERTAQMARGKSHRYVNILSMLVYWTVILEHNKFPVERVKFLMRRYPELVEGLSDIEKSKIPNHLYEIYSRFLIDKGDKFLFPLPVYMSDTGLTRDKVRQIFEDNPGSMSNEKFPANEDIWAHGVLDALVSGKNARAIKADGGKIVLALETDNWVPDEQKAMIQRLVQQVGKLSGAGTVEIVRGSSDELAGKLNEVIERDKVPLKNVIVLGSQDTINRKEFDAIRATSDTDIDKAFMAAIDGAGLTGDSYIRLLEMITMAVRMAFNQKPISNHPAIEVITKNPRLVVFIPRAEPMDFDAIKRIYDSQVTILAAA